MRKHFSRIALGSALALSLTTSVVAQTTPVDDLEAETTKLTDVYDDIVPVAVGAAVFGIGMALIKRVAFS